MRDTFQILVAVLIGAAIAACGRKEAVKEEKVGTPLMAPTKPLNIIQAPIGGTGTVITAYPQELYAGENVITFSTSGGISRIEALFDKTTQSFTEIVAQDFRALEGCPDSYTVWLRVNTVSTPLSVQFRVTDCENRAQMMTFNNRTWRLDEVPFSDVVVGDTVCRPFQIGLAGVGAFGGQEVLDSVSVPMPGAFLRFGSMGAPPKPLESGSTYRYTVCFVAKEPGTYRFPVITWMRRSQSAGGYTNYPVADTAVVRVLKSK